jgi:hypothetical protein
MGPAGPKTGIDTWNCGMQLPGTAVCGTSVLAPAVPAAPATRSPRKILLKCDNFLFAIIVYLLFRFMKPCKTCFIPDICFRLYYSPTFSKCTSGKKPAVFDNFCFSPPFSVIRDWRIQYFPGISSTTFTPHTQKMAGHTREIPRQLGHLLKIEIRRFPPHPLGRFGFIAGVLVLLLI